MDDKELAKNLSALGFNLLEAEKSPDVDATLAGVVTSYDLRLWEGFPVVLANSARKGLWDYNRVRERLNDNDRVYLEPLVMMSLALYRALGLKFGWADELYLSLSQNQRQQVQSWRNLLAHDKDFELEQHRMSAQRLKNTFNAYFKQAQTGLNDLMAEKTEVGLEYALSQVFSAKQKELFLKKLRGEKMTKTETEYYSRTVRKKVKALADEQLHRLAVRLLE